MNRGLRRSIRYVSVAIFSGITILASGFSVAPVGAQVVGPIDCPAVMPVAALQKGMTVVGWTVVEGETPSSFDVLVKGVLPDGMGPGRDLIIVELSGQIIDKAGGAWFGMSGSPVYVNGQLIGAVSTALAFGPTTIVGLTPGEEMARLFDYPVAGSSSSPPQPTADSRSLPSSLRMTRSEMAGLRTTQGTEQEGQTSFVQMKLPLSVSGAPAKALAKLTRVISRERAPFVPYAGASASSAAQQQTATMHAGGNFAAALSYGDLTMTAIATTTMVCNGQAVAFGHPFFFEGTTTLGANAASSIAIVKDPIFGSYKLAVVEEPAGTVDQDRLAGLRAVMGSSPPVIPITSGVVATGTGRSRDGQTNALLSEMVPFLAPYHVYSNIIVTLDRFGEGSSNVSWTITGHTESGEPFELTRSNMFASEWGIEYWSVSELEGQLYQLFYNDIEEITFDSVDVDASVDEEVRRLSVSGVAVSVDGGEFVERRRVRARPGDVLELQVTLSPFDGSADVIVPMSVTIPENARQDAIVRIAGGQGRRGSTCFYNIRACVRESGGQIETIQDLVDALEALPKSNELRATVEMGRRSKVRDEAMATLDQVIVRSRRIHVIVSGSRCCAAEPRPVEGRPRRAE